MKYQSVESFEKHVKEAFPNHFSSSYLIICSQDYERSLLLEKVADAFQIGKHSCFRPSSLEEALELLTTKSLFAETSLVLLDQIDKLGKQDLEKLGNYMVNPSSFSYLVMGASSSKSLEELYKKTKKELVLLDVSEEKPWDKEKRIAKWIMETFQKEQKKVSFSTASYLLKQYGTDVATLTQEMEKIFCFIADKTEVRLEEILPVLSETTLSLTGWQIAEKVIWNETLYEKLPASDASFFISLIGQIRYHLQLGMQIAAWQESKKDLKAIAEELPSVKPANLERFYHLAMSYKKNYFEKGLLELFEMEKACKTGSVDIVPLWDIFTTKLGERKVFDAVQI